MRRHPHNMPRDERERVLEQQMAVDLMIAPWAWTMAPLWAWWADPPAPPRWPAPDALMETRMDDRLGDLGDARR